MPSEVPGFQHFIQHRVGRFPSSSLRFQSPANGGTEGGVKTIEGRFPGCSSPNLSISSKQSPSNACLEAKKYSSCQFIQANSFSSLIWSSISLNSGVFITSAFRCFLMTSFRYRRHASLFSSVTNGGHCSP